MTAKWRIEFDYVTILLNIMLAETRVHLDLDQSSLSVLGLYWTGPDSCAGY